MAFDVARAKAAGYSDQEIQQYLASNGGGQQVAPDTEDLKRLLILAGIRSPKDAAKYSTKVELLKNLTPEPLSSDRQKKVDAKEESEILLRELEDRYFFSERGPLAYSKKGEVGRIGGRLEGLKANQIAGYNDDLLTFNRQRETAGPRLAKLAGDTGNIALQEQLRALKGLPEGSLTFDEAIKMVNSTRKKFGLPERNIESELKNRGVVQATKGDGTVIPLQIKGAGKALVAPDGQDVTKPFRGNVLQRLLNTTREKVDVSLPDLPYKELGGIIGSFAPGIGKIIGPVAGVGLGKSLSQIKKGGISLTREAAKRDYPSAFGPLGGAKEQATVLKEALPYTIASLVLGGHKTVGGIRNLLAKGKNIAGEEVLARAVPQLKAMETPAYTSAIQKALGGLQQFYGGRGVPALAALTKRSTLGDLSRKVAGDIKSTIAAQIGDVERAALSKAIKKAVPGGAILDKIDSILYSGERAAKAAAKPVIGAGLIGGGLYGLKKILEGVGFNTGE